MRLLLTLVFFLPISLMASLDPTPYLLPDSHPIKTTLDAIFSHQGVLRSPQAFEKSGFITLQVRPLRGSFRVAKHPLTPGYLFKVYLQSEATVSRRNAQERLTRRAIEAHRIRRFIKKKDIRHFTIASKWIYKVPSTGQIVLVVQDMQLVSFQETEKAWKTAITPSHLKELLSLLSRGFGSLGLRQNIPYTKNGTFAFIDTESPPRKFRLQRVEKHLAPDMSKEWRRLRKKKELR